MSRAAALGLAWLAAAPALAESYDCAWTSECFGPYGCEETSYDTTLTDDGGDWVFSGVAGDAPVQEMTPEGETAARLFLVPPTEYDSAMTMLTIDARGEAAFTQHGTLDGTSVVTYFGRCEAG